MIEMTIKWWRIISEAIRPISIDQWNDLEMMTVDDVDIIHCDDIDIIIGNDN